MTFEEFEAAAEALLTKSGEQTREPNTMFPMTSPWHGEFEQIVLRVVDTIVSQPTPQAIRSFCGELARTKFKAFLTRVNNRANAEVVFGLALKRVHCMNLKLDPVTDETLVRLIAEVQVIDRRMSDAIKERVKP